MPTYSLVTFSASRLDEVAGQWRQLAGDDVYEVELVPLFDFCRENRSFRPGYAVARGLQDDETGLVVAILETVPSPLRSRTKLLKIWLSPSMWSPDDVETIVHTYVGAYVSVLAEAISEGLTEVKMYGRDETARIVLTNVCDMWDSAATGWVAKMEGRWLALREAAQP